MAHLGVGIENLGGAEVDDFNRIYLEVLVEEKVLWLQVSVHDLPVVTVNHGA